MDFYEEFTKDRYGSFELKRYVARYLWIGLAISVGLHGCTVGSYVAGIALTRKPPAAKRIIVLDPSKLGAPPSITDKTAPPSIKVSQPTIAPPATAKPVAVPDEEEKEEVTIQSQEELAKTAAPTIDSALGAADVQVKIEELKLEDDAIPASDVFTAYEVAPQPIVAPKPDYPEMAKTAGVKGRVILWIFVDKKGEVRKWEVKKATPAGLGFEEEAIKAVQKWKFTPAIQQNSPVGVWVAIPINFEFKQ
jgi:protein TonB